MKVIGGMALWREKVRGEYRIDISSCSLDICEVKMGENEGYWMNGAMEREGKGAFIAMLFAMQGLILALAIYIFTK